MSAWKTAPPPRPTLPTGQPDLPQPRVYGTLATPTNSAPMPPQTQSRSRFRRARRSSLKPNLRGSWRRCAVVAVIATALSKVLQLEREERRSPPNRPKRLEVRAGMRVRSLDSGDPSNARPPQTPHLSKRILHFVRKPRSKVQQHFPCQKLPPTGATMSRASSANKSESNAHCAKPVRYKFRVNAHWASQGG